MKNEYSILKEEFPATEEQIVNFNKNRKINLPEDYRNFLLEFNGGIPIPNYIKSSRLKIQVEIIDRFYSLQDIAYEVYDNQVEINKYIQEDISEYFPDIEFEKLIPIGLCHAGKNLHIYCGLERNGEIYYSDYSGGVGLEKTGLTSFSELLNGLSVMDDEYYEPDPRTESDKIFTFNNSYYWEEENREKSLKRFEDILGFYGSPNRISKNNNKSIVEYYLDFPVVLNYLICINAKLPVKISEIQNIESLEILISNGVNIDGMLNSTRNIDIIKYLVEKCNQNLNEQYDGTYPLFSYAKIEGDYSLWERKTQYELIRDILNLGFNIDVNIKDKNGQKLKEKIEILKKFYDEYQEIQRSRENRSN